MKSAIALPEFKPDQSNNSGVLLEARNVFPAMDGYRSVGDVAAVSDALDEGFLGGGSAIASDGDAFLLAGTATDLYKLGSDQAWTSILNSLTVPQRWKFATFKDSANDDYAIAVNGTSISYAVELAGATAAAITDCPGASDVCVVGDHVVVARPDGDISAVAWSAFGDHTGWTYGTNQSGIQPMRTGGPVQAVIGGEYGIILQRNRIVRMTPTADASAPFQFDEISSNYGCADGATVAQAGRTIFFFSDRGFMALDDGQVLRRVGSEKVDRTFGNEVARDNLNQLYTAIDPQNALVMWLVPGQPGTMWTYNFELDRWSRIQINAKGLFPGFTTSVKLDALDALGYTDLDTMTISLDDPFWSGGDPRLYLVTWADRVGNLTGDTLAAQIDMGFSEFAKGRKARVRNYRPIWDGNGGISLLVDSKQRLGDALSTTTASTLNTSGIIPIRVTGKYLSTSIRIAAGTDWNYIQGIEVEFDVGAVR